MILALTSFHVSSCTSHSAVVFDMDGTLTESPVDYADMRARIGIPVGDIFAVMEHWDNPEGGEPCPALTSYHAHLCLAVMSPSRH